jgi:O-antigen/teichoic acid export membrane protein
LATKIGLRVSGLVNFGGRFFSAFTGLLFAVMVARWLVPAQFGLWEVIMDLVTFSAYPVAIVGYWATRGVARGRMLGKTALGAGGILSVGGLGLYYVFALGTSTTLAASVLPFLLGALLVPLTYWSVTANSVVSGYRPTAFGYSLVVSEIAKVVVAYLALYVYRLGIQGVLVALIFAYLVQSLVASYLTRGASGPKVDFVEMRRWTSPSLAWIPLVSQLPLSIAAADTYVASLGFGTAIAGFYQVAFIVASVVGYSSALAISLYPLLLRGGDPKLPAIAMEFTLLFAVPLTVGAIVLAGPMLYVFGKTYLPGSEGLAILAVFFVFTTISGIVDQTLLGTERVDMESGSDFRKLAKSNLLFVPLLNLSSTVVYIVSMFVSMWFAFSHGFSTSATVALWASAQLAVSIVFLIIKAARARRYAKLMPGFSVVYYLVSAALMGVVVFYVAQSYLPANLDALAYGVRLIGVVALGTLVYFGLVFALDPKFRRLAFIVLRRTEKQA